MTNSPIATSAVKPGPGRRRNDLRNVAEALTPLAMDHVEAR